MAKKRVKRRKLKRKSFLFLFLIIILIVILLLFLDNLKITSINVSGNTLYSEWEIIKKAGLEDYPSTLRNLSGTIENKLEKDPYIKNAEVTKSFFTNVKIEIEENLPLFYYVPERRTILADKSKTKDNFPVPTVINYIPDKLYTVFLKNTCIKEIIVMRGILYMIKDLMN